MWKYKVNNKLRDKSGPYYGFTDYNKKIITINKEIHKKKKSGTSIPKKDQTLINTIVHEELHKNHPKMHEKTVMKVTKKKVKSMGEKAKKRLYSKLS